MDIVLANPLVYRPFNLKKLAFKHLILYLWFQLHLPTELKILLLEAYDDFFLITMSEVGSIRIFNILTFGYISASKHFCFY